MLVIASCKNKEQLPDVSGYHASVIISRFDTAFFGMDTTEINDELNRLNASYPAFLQDYLFRVLGIDPSNPQATDAVKAFLRTYRPVFDTAQLIAGNDLPALNNDMQQALKYIQYYVPPFKPDSPFVITTFVGPMDAYEPFAIGDYGDVRTRNGVGIALQLHLGAAAGLYETGRQSGIFFDYQTRRFTPDMMLVNAMKNVIEDIFPYNNSSLNLVEDMVEKGKRLYLLKKALPQVPDSLQYGYTGMQVKGCERNEALIWNYFVKNDLLYSKDPMVNQAYIKDGPKTPELGDGAPGYVGLFVGRKLVESYMEKFPSTTIVQLMKMPAREVFEKAGYKP